MLWRRSYDTPPPPIADDDEWAQTGAARYAELADEILPRTECLADVVDRMLPYWYDAIVPDLRSGPHRLRRGARQLAAGAGQAPRRDVRGGHRRAQHPHRHPAGLPARRAPAPDRCAAGSTSTPTRPPRPSRRSPTRDADRSSGHQAGGEEAAHALLVAGQPDVGRVHVDAAPQQPVEHLGRPLHPVLDRRPRATSAGARRSAGAPRCPCPVPGRAPVPSRPGGSAATTQASPVSLATSASGRSRVTAWPRWCIRCRNTPSTSSTPSRGDGGPDLGCPVEHQVEVDLVDRRLVQLAPRPEPLGAAAEREVPARRRRVGAAQHLVEVLRLAGVPVLTAPRARRARPSFCSAAPGRSPRCVAAQACTLPTCTTRSSTDQPGTARDRRAQVRPRHGDRETLGGRGVLLDEVDGGRQPDGRVHPVIMAPRRRAGGCARGGPAGHNPRCADRLAGDQEDDPAGHRHGVVGDPLVVAAEQGDVDGRLDAVLPVVAEQRRGTIERRSWSISSSASSSSRGRVDVAVGDDAARPCATISSATAAIRAIVGTQLGRAPRPSGTRSRATFATCTDRSPIRSRSADHPQRRDEHPQVAGDRLLQGEQLEAVAPRSARGRRRSRRRR